MVMRSDQEIPFPRTQDIRVSETWRWGQPEDWGRVNAVAGGGGEQGQKRK